MTMKHLHEMTIEGLKNLNRDQLITLLVNHDSDGEYSDEQRTALGEELLSFEDALNIAIIHLNEVNS